MEQISAAFASISAICGKQKVQPDGRYRFSRHCLSVPVQEGLLLYHTLTGALFLQPNGQEENREELIRNRILVTDGFDEREYTDEIRRILIQAKAGKGINDFTILTTTDCNARCFYCYEQGIRRFSMSRETAYGTARYIVRVSGGKPVHIRWFGGEPLFHREAIDIICKELRDCGVEYESDMVSNGFYLDEPTAGTAYEQWHLKKIQITIDGTEENYRRIKAYIDADENPYRRVMNNIESALKAGIRVTIRLNMDARNAEDLLLAVENIAVRFAGYANLDVYPALLHEFNGSVHAYEEQQKAEQDFRTLRKKLEEAGLLRQKQLPKAFRLNRCMADTDTSETILPDGRVGRCEHYSEEMITGTIHDDRRDREVTARWKKPLTVPECADCVLYPQCRKLEMCEWNRDGCNETDRNLGIEEIKKQMLAAYREFKERGGTT